MNYLSSFELGFSLFNPRRKCGATSSKLVGPVQCTSCAECEVVLVACTMDAAPTLKEWVCMHGGAYDVGSVC